MMHFFVLSVAVLSLLVASTAKTNEIQPFQYNGIHFIGRFGKIDNSVNFQSNWPGSSFLFSVIANYDETVSSSATSSITTVSVTFNVSQSQEYYIAVEENCGPFTKYEINKDNDKIILSFESQKGAKREFKFTKITEASCGDATGLMEVTNLEVSGGILNPVYDVLSNTSCYEYSRKMLVVGDSISAAYGVEGVSAQCSFSASTENVLESYASIVASAINAQLHVVAWSGKGVVRNYGDENQMSEDPMPIFYNRTSATVSTESDPNNYWEPSAFTPDVVLVMLGSNDYSTQPQPSDEQFTNGLVALLEQIKLDYPNAALASMCAPSANGNQCANIQAATLQTSSPTTYIYIDPSAYDAPDGGYGCDWHPSVDTQKNIASYVTPVVEKMLGLV